MSESVSPTAPEASDRGRVCSGALIGAKLRRAVSARASVDSIIIFANGVGSQPALRPDTRAGRASANSSHRAFRGRTLAWPLCWGLPRASFGVAIDCEFYRPGDRVNIWNRVLDVDKQSNSPAAWRCGISIDLHNKRDEIVCRALGLTARHERSLAREGQMQDIRPFTDGDAPASTPWCYPSLIAFAARHAPREEGQRRRDHR
jgi:hypothetical protein